MLNGSSQYLSELEDEYYKLRANGYSGEGFDAPGKRLGQGVAHNVPWHQAKSQAALAAEKRARAAGIMGPAGGRKLGGVPTRIGAKTPRELSAAVSSPIVVHSHFNVYLTPPYTL